MAEKQIPIPYHSFIIFTMGLLIYTFTLLLIGGKIFNLYSSNEFPNEEYFQFWKNMTSDQRLFLTETYYKFYLTLKQKLINFQENNKNKNIKIDIKFLSSTHLDFYKQFENVPFVLVSLIPKDKNQFKKKLLIASHFDGHNLTDGGTAYDDAIHTVTMLGVIDTITKKENLQLSTQIDFLFDGAEEYGLIGAYQYVDYLKNNNITENYDYLNLESMGASPPYGFVIKNGEGNFRVQKALSKTRGTILLSMNYLYDTGMIQSTTDHAVFNKQKWTGGVNVFLGKASVYHTKYDKIEKENNHLKIAGCQLLDFVMNYEPEDDSYNGNSVGYGIAPICIVLPVLVFYIVIPIIFVISVILIIIKERKNIKEFLYDLLFSFITFIIVLAIYMVLGFLVYLINPDSASGKQTFVYLTAIMGLFLFLIFQRIFKIKRWGRFRLVFDLILMIIFIGSDLSLALLTLTILSTVSYFFENKIVKYISSFFQYLVMSLILAFMMQLFLQFSIRLEGLLSNIFVFILFFIYSFHITASPLDIYDITQEDKIIGLIKGLFKKEENNDEVNNNEVVYNINDELIDNENIEKPPSISTKEKNKPLKNMPVYLLFFYLLYFISILLVLFLKPYPFDKSYTVIGDFFNIYTDMQNSTMIFSPFNGYNYAKKYAKKNGLNFIEENITEFLKGTEYNSKVFAVKSQESININNPECNFNMPDISEIMKIEYINISDNKYEFKFNINISNTSCIDLIYLYIHCDNCVEKVNGINKKSEKHKVNVLLIRSGKKEINDQYISDFITETNMILNINEFNYTLLLNTMKNSKNYLKFLDSFGEASVNCRGTSPSDTIYKYDKNYKP